MKYYFKIIFFALLTINSFSSAQGYGSWFATDSMIEKRRYQAGIQLDNGNILITGGYGVSGPAKNSAEIFDKTNLKWSAAPSMNKGHGDHNLIKLNDGSIMAIGGYGEKTCEILDKDLTSWTLTDSLKISRWSGQSVVVLQNGNVLLIGGYKGNINDPSQKAFTDCEIYDNIGKIWETTTELNIGRFEHSSTILKDGRILVAGGNTINNSVQILNTCEIFDPVTKIWTTTTPMHYPRAGHSAKLLSNGKVMVIGGNQSVCEIYNPGTNQWEDFNFQPISNSRNNTFLLSNEEYLLVVYSVPLWELYSLQTNKSIINNEFKKSITDPVIVQIDNNRVLFSGGNEFIEEYSFYTAANLSQVYDLNLTSVKEGAPPRISPNDFSLSCYPNPFNSTTTINYSIVERDYVSLKVYNILGKLVVTLIDNIQDPGFYNVKFNGTNLSSGFYIYKLTTNNNSSTNKMLLLK